MFNQSNYAVIPEKKSLYFGGVYRGMKHGIGVYLTSDTAYEGEFSLDYKSGRGWQRFPNGSVYVGEFQNNKTHGEGELRFQD